MKLLKILMALCFGASTIPVFARDTTGFGVRNETEANANVNRGPTNKRTTNQKSEKITPAGSDLMLSQKEKMRRPVLSTYTCRVHPGIANDKPGRCTQCGKLLHRHIKEKTKVIVQNIYACPGHPGVTGKKNSSCAQWGSGLKRKPYSSNHPHTAPTCVNRGKFGNCRSCTTDGLLSPKEKMKMDVMKICCCSTEPAVNQTDS